MFRKLSSWIKDYCHAVSFYGKSFVYREPPEHYLGRVSDEKYPIILVPGLNTKWQFLKLIADELSLLGHPIYIIKKLKYNRKSIVESAHLLREVIDQENITDVIIVAHSKRGFTAI